tara:strand:- start:2055 stop:2768 length:714 start_codon:yes stop_codon:yes gene_type:complete
MGKQVSNEVSYGFGQFGSAITDGTVYPIYPPPGLKIVAITALANTTFNSTGGLVADGDKSSTLLGGGAGYRSKFINTENGSHLSGPIHQSNNNTIKGHNNNGNADHDTGEITLSSADARIKPGMIIENHIMCPRDIENPYVVKSYDGVSTAEALVIARQNDPSTAVDHAGDIASGDNGTLGMLAFYEPQAFKSIQDTQGHGGLTMDVSDEIPTGVTIYGRWNQAKIASGRIICYFGI